jgi:hypothetical protein
MTLAEFRTRHGLIWYAATTDGFRRPAPLINTTPQPRLAPPRDTRPR